MRKLFLTPAEAEEYATLAFNIQRFKAERDACMKRTVSDYRFLKACGVEFFETETLPSFPGYQPEEE